MQGSSQKKKDATVQLLYHSKTTRSSSMKVSTATTASTVVHTKALVKEETRRRCSRRPCSAVDHLIAGQPSPPTTLLSAGISIRRRRPAELSPLPSNPSSSVVRRLFLPVSSSLFSLLSSSDRQCCGAPSPPSFSTSRITMEPQTQGL
ncbi:uncharacterized protein DS421_5g141430 [Arachis hypogaea]|nr:uncharacterized protein DS421_5g141430 [Arachis hypogaea]